MELEYRTYWAIKKFNFDMQQASSKRRLPRAELEEIHNDAYENDKIYKRQMKVVRKCFYSILSCTYSQVSYALDGLALLLFTLFFHMD